MKRTIKAYISGFITASLITATVTFASYGVMKEIYYDSINVVIDGRIAAFPADMKPFIMDDRAFLSLRAIAELLGRNVEYDEETSTAYINEKPAETPEPTPTPTPAPTPAPAPASSAAPEAKPDSFITVKKATYNTDMTELRITGQGLTDSDIGPLRHMTDLTVLDLSGNAITDIGALKGLTGLTELILNGNPIESYAPLKDLTNLTVLELKDCRDRDISQLRNLRNLTRFHVSCELITRTEVYDERDPIYSSGVLQPNGYKYGKSEHNIDTLRYFNKLKSLTVIYSDHNQAEAEKYINEINRDLKTILPFCDIKLIKS